MSDSVVKLRIDSKEYDANIKRAGQALTDYFNKVKEGGGTLKYLDDGVLEAVQAMGKLGTQASSVKGGLRELTQATSDMTVAYRALTDEEKASPIGAAMAESIQQMTERAGEMRDAMADVQAGINNAASDTRQFDQVAGAMQAATAGFQTVTGAAKLMGIQMGDDVEVIAKLQAAMAVTSGFQTMQNLLQKQSALMQGVNALQKEFNILAKANPYVLLATAAAAVVAAYVAWTSGARDAEKAQKALNHEIEATKIQLNEIDRETNFNVAIAEAAGKSADAIHKMRVEAAKAKFELADANWNKLFDAGASKEQLDEADRIRNEAWKSVMAANDKWTEGTIQKLYGKGSGNKSGGRSSLGTQKEQTEEQMNSARIDKLTQEYISATDQRRQAIEKEIATIQKRNEEIAKLKDMALGKSFDAGSIGEVTVTGNRSRQFSKLNEGNIGGMMSDIKQQIQTADIGSELYNNLTAKLVDTNTFKTVIEAMVKNGIDVADIDASSLWQKIVSGENIENADWQGMVDKINAKLKEMELDPITIDFNTGGIVKTGKETEKSWQAAAQAVQSVGSALQQIEDPGAKIAGIIGQAIANIALGFAMATAKDSKLGVFGWIAAIAGGLGTMMSTISAIHNATGYATGGIVEGTTYSGDQIPAMLNAGEVVLNHAQTANVANALEGGGMRGIDLSAKVNGEQIVLVANRYYKRTGQGEIVTWK